MIIYKGTEYKVGDFIIINENETAMLTHLFPSSNYDLVITEFEIFKISFDKNLRAFKLSESQGIVDVKLLSEFSFFPRNTHSVSGQKYILKKML